MESGFYMAGKKRVFCLLRTAQPLLESVGRHGDMVLSDPPITDKKRNREQLSLISTFDLYFFGSGLVELGVQLASAVKADARSSGPPTRGPT